jgi:two-component system nitrogen regulation response regulator NtrX
MQILVVDDEKNIRLSLSNLLRDEGHQVLMAESGEEGLRQIEMNPLDLVFLDVKLPKMNGIEVLQQIKKENPEIDILMISGNSDIDTAVKAVKLGAYDFMEKPLSMPKILITVQNLMEKRRLLQKSIIGTEEYGIRYQLIGESPQVNNIRQVISRVAKTDAKVLITGESGTGKELVAYAIHRLSQRSSSPFVTFNSAAIPKELVESELFGYEKGAFTGADRRKPGKLEMANGGTLFLDEIGDMNLDAQSKILRVLEQGQFERVGGNQSIKIDVRILAATNREIKAMVSQGTFREDLFYRLNVVPVFLPPLREREGDVAVLIDYYLAYYAREMKVAQKSFSRDALELLDEYKYPGNIRELKNLIERLYILIEDRIISKEDVLPNLHPESLTDKSTDEFITESNFNRAKAAFEKHYLIRKLKSVSWNISRAAVELGLQQSNLSRKLKSLGIEIPSH